MIRLAPLWDKFFPRRVAHPDGVDPRASGAGIHGRAMLATLLVAAAIAHLPSLWNGFVGDDLTFILGNPVLRDARNIPALFARPESWGADIVTPYYRPLTTLTFLADTLMWGASPLGFHVTNVLLHLAVCGLLLAVLRSLLAPAAAFAAALAFAVHPAHAEPVAYVSARGDLVCALFLLSSFLAWVRYGETRRRGALLLSALAFGAALLAKITAGLFPAVFALHGLWFFRRRPRARDLLPFAAVALCFLAVRSAVLEVEAWPGPPPVSRAATAGPVTMSYFLMAISPAHLSVFHSSPPRPQFDATAIAAWLAIAAVLGAGAACAKQAPRAVLGLAWFLAGIVPVSGLVTVLQPAIAADRYLYIPLLGAAIAAGAGLQRLAALRLPAPLRNLGAAGAAAVLVALAIVTMDRSRLWREPVTFWERAALEAPRAASVLNALAWTYNLEHREADAERTLRRSLAVGETPQAYVGLASFALRRGDLAAGLRHTLRALDLAPGSNAARRHLGLILHVGGDDEVVLRAAERARALHLFEPVALERLEVSRELAVGGGETAD